MRITLLAGFSLLFCSCTTSHPIHSKGGRESFGKAAVEWESLDGNVWLMIWTETDGPDGGLASFFFDEKLDATTGQVSLHRIKTTLAGQKFEVRATTHGKGDVGIVEINEKQFRLENGQIFLVSTQGPKLGIVQASVDLSKFQPTRANLDRLAQSAPVIKAFVDPLKAK